MAASQGMHSRSRRRPPTQQRPARDVKPVYVRMAARSYKAVRTLFKDLNIDINHIKWYSWVGRMVLELLVVPSEVDNIVGALVDCQMRALPDFDPANPPESVRGRPLSLDDIAHMKAKAVERVEVNISRRNSMLGARAPQPSDAIVAFYTALQQRAGAQAIDAPERHDPKYGRKGRGGRK